MLANSADSDQAALKEQSDQCLPCLLRISVQTFMINRAGNAADDNKGPDYAAHFF